MRTLLHYALRTLYEIIESITFALAVVTILYLFLARPAEVEGYSSYPTIAPGQYVLTQKFNLANSINRGDFVIPKSPFEPDVDFIKRVIGLPGETIMLSGGQVYINGQTLPEPYLTSGTYTGPEKFFPESTPYTIPTNNYFVMGDNRAHSEDSRDFGPVALDAIDGKVLFRFWPPTTFGTLPGSH